MSNQTPGEFTQIGSDEEVAEALRPKKTVSLPMVTAILAGVVVLAVGLAGGAGLHAAFATDSTPQPQAGRGGYGGFRGQNGAGQGPAGQGNATIGTVVSANTSQLVVKTQNGDITVKLTDDTTYDITTKGSATDLEPGQQVVVNGRTTNGTLTATTIRQGTFPGALRTPGASPSR